MQDSAKTLKAQILLCLYWLHLSIPLLLAFDSLWQWYLHVASTSEYVVLTVSLLWLAVGVGSMLIVRNRAGSLDCITGPLLMVYTLVLSGVAAEIGLRLFISPSTSEATVYKPESKWVFEVDSTVLPGTRGPVTFTVNNDGLRGLDLSRGDQLYKIVAVGGSTTQGRYLDDSATWPYLLMQYLNQGQQNVRVWVGNAGVGGHTTVHHFVALQNIPALSRAEMLILLVGVNDMGASLAAEGKSTQATLENASTIFLTHTHNTHSGSFLRQTKLFQITQIAYINSASMLLKRRPGTAGVLAEDTMSFYVSMRKRRAALPTLPLPDLSIGLEEYAKRIRALEQECRSRHLRCVFLTQPSMWKTGLSPYEQGLLTSGWIGPVGKPKGCASVPDLARAMQAYNQTLLDVCSRDGLECYDLSSAVPKNTSSFYDDEHFNNNGSEIVARFVAQHLLATSPFN